jgi:hypothetical protein
MILNHESTRLHPLFIGKVSEFIRIYLRAS